MLMLFLVPGGFGERGVEGMILACKFLERTIFHI
jgi:CTP synthase (UTP-ammonia lyase)